MYFSPFIILSNLLVVTKLATESKSQKLELKLYKYNDYDKNWEEVNIFTELDCCYNI